MLKHRRQVQRLMLLLSIAGLFAVSADFACLDDVCADQKSGAYVTYSDLFRDRLRTLDEALKRDGVTLNPTQQATLARDGQLFGVVKLDQPVKHPNGQVEMPANWLPAIPKNHPWDRKLTPADDAYFSFVEERIFKAKLFDPSNPEHKKAADAYFKKVEGNKTFLGWSADSKTECEKIKADAAVAQQPDAE